MTRAFVGVDFLVFARDILAIELIVVQMRMDSERIYGKKRAIFLWAVFILRNLCFCAYFEVFELIT